MKFSDIAYKTFINDEENKKFLVQNQITKEDLLSLSYLDGMICQDDAEYPRYLIDGRKNEIFIDNELKSNELIFGKKVNKSTLRRPTILFYKGDLTLIQTKNWYKNIAVIGVAKPNNERDKALLNEQVALEESKAVELLVKGGLNIVSGLAKGCDALAHKICLKNEGKTVAILPSTINNILPKENTKLAEDIVAKGGLLLTEYFFEPDPSNPYALTNRFIMRDRLQVYFSQRGVLLCASYEKNFGDSGSRHAIGVAKSLKFPIYVLKIKNLMEEDILLLNKNLLSTNEAKVFSIDDVI
jgi:DNA processing protein